MVGDVLGTAIFVLSFCSCCHGNVLVSPASDTAVPRNSAENVTYNCTVTVTGAGTVEAVWAVQGIQVSGADGRRRYGELGVFITPSAGGMAEVVVTERGREAFTGRMIELQCIGTVFQSNSVNLIRGPVLSVISYDSPGGVVGLTLDPSSSDNLDELVLSWQPPAGGVVGVAVTYELSVTGLSINVVNQTDSTSVMFVDRAASRDCRSHVFSVAARNGAGLGPVISITRTIPIAPDLTQLNSDLTILSVSLASPITISLRISLATTCSQAFPIESYTLRSQDSAFPGVLLGNGSSLTRSAIPLVGVARDSLVDIFIEVCIPITCKNSTVLTLRTSAVQSASLLYFENNIQMVCEMASESSSRGCRFILAVGNLTEMFDVLVGEGGATRLSQCNQTMNLGGVYDSVSVVDILDSGNLGTLPLPIVAMEVADEASYTATTSCPIPAPQSALSAGGIVGIVLAALVVAAAVLVAVIVLVVCRIQTGHWFKIKEKDDHLTVNFAKEYLLSEGKQARKKKAVVPAGRNSPDIGLEEVMTPQSQSSIQESDIRVDMEPGSSATAPPPARSSILAETEDWTVVDGPTPMARSSATAPLLSSPESQHAFTLDISSDHRKVKLHLNKALIMQKLQEKRLDTMNKKKAMLKRQVSYCKLPLTCEMRVQAPEGN